MWCLFHKIQSLSLLYVSISALTGPERKDSAGNASVKCLSIKGKKKKNLWTGQCLSNKTRWCH